MLRARDNTVRTAIPEKFNSIKNFDANFRCYFYHLDAKLVKLWFNSCQGKQFYSKLKQTSLNRVTPTRGVSESLYIFFARHRHIFQESLCILTTHLPQRFFRNGHENDHYARWGYLDSHDSDTQSSEMPSTFPLEEFIYIYIYFLNYIKPWQCPYQHFSAL